MPKRDLPGQLYLDGCTPEDVKRSTLEKTRSAALTPKQAALLQEIVGAKAQGVLATRLQLSGYGRDSLNRLWQAGLIARRLDRQARTYRWYGRDYLA